MRADWGLVGDVECAACRCARLARLRVGAGVETYLLWFRLRLLRYPSCHLFIVLQEVVQVRTDILWRAANGANRVAKMTVVAEPVGIFVQACQLISRSRSRAIVRSAFANRKVLVA